MIALEVYSDAIFYFGADISKKIVAIFFVLVKLHNRLIMKNIHTLMLK
jgi:hypothetical protein